MMNKRIKMRNRAISFLNKHSNSKICAVVPKMLHVVAESIRKIKREK